MRKILLLLAVLALPAAAQETYSLSASAAQVAPLQQWTLYLNRDTCRRLALSASCTQAQACTAANAAGGASCTAGQARAAGARIWPDTQAGREEYVTFGVAAPAFNDIKTNLPSKIVIDQCVWWNAQNAATQNADCQKCGAPNGCSPCP